MLSIAKRISGIGFLLFVLFLIAVFLPVTTACIPAWLAWIILPAQPLMLVPNIIILRKEEQLGWKMLAGFYSLCIVILLVYCALIFSSRA